MSGEAIAEADARNLVARLAVLLQAATLLRVGSPLATTFVQSRLGGAGHVYGVLDAATPFTDILARALPAD